MKIYNFNSDYAFQRELEAKPKPQTNAENEIQAGGPGAVPPETPETPTPDAAETEGADPEAAPKREAAPKKKK